MWNSFIKLYLYLNASLIFYTQRCLYETREIVKIGIKDIERHCVVHYLREWQGHSNLGSEPDHFFLTHTTKSFNPTIRDLRPLPSYPFNRCKLCTSHDEDWKKFRDSYKRVANVNRLKSLDLCSGAGGLSLGLQKSGVFSTRWAVENDVQTARTYK